MTALILLLMFIGVTLVYGAYKKWEWLIDPPLNEWWSMFYSQVTVKKIIGTQGTVIFTYLLGIMFVGVGVIYFTRGIWQ
jgi:predicted tellurium resistance membrane protein TerC